MPLAALLPYAPAAISAVGALLQKKQKVRKPQEELDYWGRIAREGVYSPKAKSSLLGNYGAQTGNAAQQITADTRGRLASQGMLNSIASTRALNEPGIDRMRMLGEYSRGIDTENELSKTNAAGNYASLMGGYGQAKEDAKTYNWNNRVSGLMNAGMMGVQGWQQTQQNKLMNATGQGYKVQYPENFAQMSMQDAYSWATNYGHNWDEIQPIWQRLNDDYIVQQLFGGGGSSLMPQSDELYPGLGR